MKHSRSARHGHHRSRRRPSGDATEAYHEYSHHASRGARDEESVSVSSISALDPDGRRGDLSYGGGSAAVARRDSTAIVESVHSTEVEGSGSGPLPIDRDEIDSLGAKRRRLGQSTGVHGAPKQRRRIDGDDAVSDGGGGGEPEPTPRPKRATTILTSTPAFIREEREERRRHRGEAGQHGPLTEGGPPSMRSSLARGLSTLRESFSVLMGTPAPPPGVLPAHPRAPQHSTLPSPWGLSSIKPGSPRPSVGGSMGATVRRSGSDYAINLWPDEASAGALSHSSTTSSLASSLQPPSGHPRAATNDRLRFLRPSRDLAAANEGRGTRSTTATGVGAAHSAAESEKENRHPAVPLMAAASAAPPLPPPTGPSVRHAAPSGISENLLDIISSSSGSRVRTSHATQLQHQQYQQQQQPSLASTVMEPDVSPIMKLGAEERRRPSAPEPRPRSVKAAPAPTPRWRGDPRRIDVPLHTAAASSSHGHDTDAASRRHTATQPRYDYVAAVTEEELLTGGGESGGRHLRHDHGGSTVAAKTRRACASLLMCAFIVVVVSFSFPLLSASTLPIQPWPHRGSAVEALAVFYVNPVAELHALYQVPAGSLGREEEVQRLYHRVLGEGIERLEKAAAPLSPLKDPTATHDQRILFLHQMLVAYEAVRRRSLQYARSRDRSAWRRLLVYPLSDVWHYAVVRRERASSAAAAGGRGDGAVARSPAPWRLLARPSISGLLDRAVTAIACVDAGGADMTFLPLCPSLRFREDAMLAAAQGYLYHDVNAQFDLSQKQWRAEVLAARLRRDWDSEVYVETLLQFVRRDSLHGIRSYNTW